MVASKPIQGSNRPGLVAAVDPVRGRYLQRVISSFKSKSLDDRMLYTLWRISTLYWPGPRRSLSSVDSLRGLDTYLECRLLSTVMSSKCNSGVVDMEITEPGVDCWGVEGIKLACDSRRRSNQEGRSLILLICSFWRQRWKIYSSMVRRSESSVVPIIYLWWDDTAIRLSPLVWQLNDNVGAEQ